MRLTSALRIVVVAIPTFCLSGCGDDTPATIEPKKADALKAAVAMNAQMEKGLLFREETSKGVIAEFYEPEPGRILYSLVGTGSAPDSTVPRALAKLGPSDAYRLLTGRSDVPPAVAAAEQRQAAAVLADLQSEASQGPKQGSSAAGGKATSVSGRSSDSSGLEVTRSALDDLGGGAPGTYFPFDLFRSLSAPTGEPFCSTSGHLNWCYGDVPWAYAYNSGAELGWATVGGEYGTSTFQVYSHSSTNYSVWFVPQGTWRQVLSGVDESCYCWIFGCCVTHSYYLKFNIPTTPNAWFHFGGSID